MLHPYATNSAIIAIIPERNSGPAEVLMADTLNISCPHCSHGMAVPANLAGKKIKCKKCTGIVVVPEAGAGGTLGFADEPAKPKPAKPAKAVAKAVAKPAESTDMKRPSEDFNDDANPYGVTKDDLDIPRCPFCAYELDPPDTKICLKCGFNLLERRRHESKKVFELTTGDYVMHHLPAVACVFLIFALIGFCTFCYVNMPYWFEGSIFEMDETNPDTGKKKMYAPPGVCTLWIIVPSLFVIWKAGKFAFIRFVYRWKPTETVKK
jgi:ribosomal protein S27E